ncbi:diphosphomevalonate decarboxylase-like [Uloborus diversus]|uniref:diphosphomevalonate decarboxylase-like n=1 Tax=Uloborus diversus TaxID=327109 RepID=UPI00240A90D9|nr:diphosphomevalonate decarboxylase-like [Uloborus diversus]
MAVHTCTALAPVNIAVIKYWGKKNEDLILPVNDSISLTLSKKKMCAKTTVACSPTFESDRIWLNGIEQDFQSPRIQNCIREIKRLARKKDYLSYHLHICSENNFPTAAGLASSAAGFACLVKALAVLYDVDDELSKIARQGSGSACRSIYGGFVQWLSGNQNDGSDSIAKQIAPKEHWPEMRVMILVVNSKKKGTSSTNGMRNSVLTSSLLKHRVTEVVPQRVQTLNSAILQKNFQTFAEIAMKESNQFHAICLDTYPPIHYLNSTSFMIIELVHAYNELYKKNKLAYTFDAGCNAFLFMLEEDVPEICALIKAAFPPIDDNGNFIKGFIDSSFEVPLDTFKKLNIAPHPGLLQHVIYTQVGSGPAIISEHLLNEKGLPL